VTRRRSVRRFTGSISRPRAQHPAEASRFGVSNLIVVATSDDTLITTRDQVKRVKELVARLKDQRLDRYL